MKNAYTRIYIIYRFSTKDELDARLNYIKGDNKNIVYFHFSEDSDKHWKKKAKAKMRDCDFAILFYDNSAFPENEEPVNVEYELELVKQFNKKLITIYTSSEEELGSYDCSKLYNIEYNKIFNINFLKSLVSLVILLYNSLTSSKSYL